jgi:hypothetical protein
LSCVDRLELVEDLYALADDLTIGGRRETAIRTEALADELLAVWRSGRGPEPAVAPCRNRASVRSRKKPPFRRFAEAGDGARTHDPQLGKREQTRMDRRFPLNRTD